MGSDVGIGERTKIVEINHEHRTNIMIDNYEARTTTSVTGFSAFFRNLRERGYELIPFILKGSDAIDNLANEEDEAKITMKRVENEISTHPCKENAHRNAKKNTETHPCDSKDKDVVENHDKHNATIRASEDSNVKPLKDKRKHDSDIHNGQVKGKRKIIGGTGMKSLKRPIANSSRKHGFQMISTANILILSTLFGLALTENRGEITENKLVKSPLKRKTSDIGDDKGLNTIYYEDTLISAFDCLDGGLQGTRISLNPPEPCDIEKGSAYERPQKKKG